MNTKDKLLDKYYKGETTEEEEKQLKAEILLLEQDSAEKDIFSFFRDQAALPDDLESSIFEHIAGKEKSRKLRRFRSFTITSAAASILIILSVFLGNRNRQNQKLENDFLVLEEALFRVSESIHPEEENEMLVLWVDEYVEIIIN